MQLEKGAEQLVNAVQLKNQKAMYLEVIKANHFVLCDMVKCEIVNNRVDPMSSAVFESIARRVEEIQSDQWKGLVYL